MTFVSDGYLQICLGFPIFAIGELRFWMVNLWLNRNGSKRSKPQRIDDQIQTSERVLSLGNPYLCFVRYSQHFPSIRTAIPTPSFFVWHQLVGGIPTPLKNMSSSVGMIIYSQYMDSHKIPWFQSPPTSPTSFCLTSMGSSEIKSPILDHPWPKQTSMENYMRKAMGMIMARIKPWRMKNLCSLSHFYPIYILYPLVMTNIAMGKLPCY